MLDGKMHAFRMAGGHRAVEHEARFQRHHQRRAAPRCGNDGFDWQFPLFLRRLFGPPHIDHSLSLTPHEKAASTLILKRRLGRRGKFALNTVAQAAGKEIATIHGYRFVSWKFLN
jgi:hypothetical protein